MSLREGNCDTRGLPPGSYGYAIEVTVQQDRITATRLSGVNLLVKQTSLPMGREDSPKALASYVACLDPFLRGLPLEPPPGDGVYTTQFVARGAPRTAPAMATARRPASR